MGERELLRRTAEIAADFIDTLDERPVWPPASVEELRAAGGRSAIRISVSNWRTSDEDVSRAVAAFERAIPANR